MTDHELWLVAAIAMAVAGVVKGATGIGYATFALPLLASLVGLKTAMALIIAPTLAVNFSLAFSGGQFRENVGAFLPLYLAMLPGVAAGAVMLAIVDQRIAIGMLGASMVAYAGLALAMPKLSLHEKTARWLRLPVGFINGVLTGLTGAQVIPLVPYMMALHMPTGQTIQAINIGVLVLSSMLGVSLVATKAVEPLLIGASIAGILPALAGAALGASLQSKMPAALLRTLILTIVGLSGLKLIVW